MGRSEVERGGAFGVNLVSVGIGPRPGFFPGYDARAGHDSAHYGRYLEKVQGHPFLLPGVRAATEKYAAMRFQHLLDTAELRSFILHAGGCRPAGAVPFDNWMQ